MAPNVQTTVAASSSQINTPVDASVNTVSSQMFLILAKDLGQVLTVSGGKTEQAKAAEPSPSTDVTPSSDAPSPSSPPSQGESIQTTLDAILAAGTVINSMILLFMNDAAAHSKIMSAEGQALLDKCTAEMTKLIQELQELKDAEADASKWGVVSQILGIIVAAILTMIAAITLQPELIAVAVVAIIMSTPAGAKIMQGFTEAFQAMGMSQSTAAIFGSIAFALIVAGLSCGAGSLGIVDGAAAAAAPAAAGGDVVAAGADAAADADAADGVANAADKPKVEIPSRIKQYTRIFRMGAANGLMQGGLIQNILATSIPQNQQGSWWAIVITVAAMLFLMGAGGAGNDTTAFAPASDADPATLLGRIKIYLSNTALNELRLSMKQALSDSLLSKLNDRVGNISLKGVMQLGLGAVQIYQMIVQSELASAFGQMAATLSKKAPTDELMTLFQVIEDILTQNQNSYQKNDNSQIDALNGLLSGLSKMLGGVTSAQEVLANS